MVHLRTVMAKEWFFVLQRRYNELKVRDQTSQNHLGYSWFQSVFIKSQQLHPIFIYPAFVSCLFLSCLKGKGHDYMDTTYT